ncbi:MAG: lamin tail domain-containing protein, partial [Limisphaerales bacterium]
MRFQGSLLKIGFGLSWMVLSAVAASAASQLVLSEFLASNGRNRADENGDFEDWIEIRNTSGTAVSTAGWALTDDVDVPGKWRFPAVTIPAGGFLVVFASGKDRAVPGANLHTSFQLNDEGEYLALIEPDGETVATEFAPQYPPQVTDVSYGLTASGTPAFFSTPTPGAANGTGSVDRVADTKFSVDRGFHQAPFDLAITCATPDVQIRYTTNGTPPTATSGMVWPGSLRISGTTVLRAAAFKAGWLPSNVDTHTYLFTSDIIRQSPTGAPPPGWPTSWGSNTRDYGMDPDVVNDPRYRNTIQNDLKLLPSFCVTVHLPDLFDPTRGIYANPGQDGRTWERPMSLELISTNGTSEFQVDGGIRIRGGFSRSTSNPKHAFRFFFRQEYGDSKLRYPVFGDGAAEEYDGFDLRTFQNYSWSFQGDGRGTFMRDVFNRDVQLAMGQPGERGDYYHLYINGQYWGLFNTCERPEASYAETYLGGNKDDYDVIKVEAGVYNTVATDGNLSSWTTLYNLVKPGVNDTLYRRLLGQNPDGTRNPDYPVYVDADNLIDYMLIILWGGNLDAPISNFLGNSSPNNYFGIWNRVTRDRGFQFFVHDAEHTLLDLNSDRTGPFSAGDSSVSKSNPQWLWQKLQGSAEFRLQVGDRIRRHFFGNGVLTPAKARELYLRRRAEIDRAVVAESARWGDSKRASDPFTRDDDWLGAVQQNLNFIAGRSAVVLQQLRNDGLFPQVASPQFNQEGGPISNGFGLLMAPNGATIYYTLNGSDPRQPGGGIGSAARRYQSPVALTESVTVKARTLENGVWSALTEADFVVIQTFKDLVIHEIHYHPTGTADRDGDDFEFLELKNTGRATLDLSGVYFTDGIRYEFPNGTRLAAGAFAVLVRDSVAFKSRYPGVTVAGVYEGALNNGGERLTLVHAVGTPLTSVTYDTRPPWPALADGQGFSLVPSGTVPMPNPDDPSQWRASSRTGGSPGADDAPEGLLPVLVNEILTHTDPPLVDAVELFNPNDAPAPIGGWWLSDDRGSPKKYRIPAGRVIPPRGYVVFSELDYNRPEDGPNSFTFSSYGDGVWLSSADATGNLTGFSDGFEFGAAENAVTFGRFTNSVGAIHYPAQRQNSMSEPNLGPRIGPVVLNEILYVPGGVGAPFVEIRNITALPVPLYDLLAPTNTWRIEGIGFEFPIGVVLPPGGLAVVTASDPQVFRERQGLPESALVFGPYSGVLQSGGETLTLERPDKPDPLPDGSWFVPYLAVDRVRYDDQAPWPVQASAGGISLERQPSVDFADDPLSWRASFGEPSPGYPNDGNRAPEVMAGSDREVEGTLFPMAVTLEGWGADDGLPVAPGRTDFAWSQVGGPGVADFDDASRTNGVVRLPGTGTYTLRLTATDGERSRTDDVVIVVRRPAENATWIASGSSWRYLDDGSNQGTAWRQAGFNDAAWRQGNAQFGYGDGDEVTSLRSAVNGARSTTFYFRRTFNVSDLDSVT